MGEVQGSIFFNWGDDTVDSSRVRFRREKGRLRANRALPGPCSSATCYLTYRGVVTDRVQIFRTEFMEDNPRWSAFRALVGEPAALVESLREAEGGDPLEHSASILFHLLGFATSDFGPKTFRTSKGTSDILAFSPDGQICLVVECTSGEPNLSEKIAKLATRTRTIEQTHASGTAQPVLLTRQRRTEIIKTVTKIAADERVALITVDDFDGLVQLASGIPKPEQVMSHLSGVIPSEVL